MRILKTVLLCLLAIFFVTAAAFMAVEGNLARLTGWYHYRPGNLLFSAENIVQLENVSWMRIADLHDKIECSKDKLGNWWIVSPFHDRLDPEVARDIMLFTSRTKVVDTLPLNNTTRGSMREFGVETMPHTITLKVHDGEDTYSTVARYTLGSASPWLADAEDGKDVLPTTYLRTDFYGRDKRVHVVTGNILHLFRNGLSGLRDPHPLQFQAEHLDGISIISAQNTPIELRRASSESAWVIAKPCIAAADQGKVEKLLSYLSRITALRVEEAEDVTLPDTPDCVISLHSSESEGKNMELVLYPPFFSEKDGQQVRYATVADRSVIFTLRDMPKIERKGSYSSIVKAICKLPVLNEKAMAQVKMSLSGDAIYIDELPLSVPELRSTRFADIDIKEVERFYLRSQYASFPLQVRLIPGDSSSGVSDAWIFSAEGRPMQMAEPEMVKLFINSLRDIPVTDFLADIKPGEEAAMRQRFGLDNPTYILVVAPRSCAYRATLFGHDLPLVRDHATRAFFVNRYTDPTSGKGMWVGMEEGGNTIYALSTKLTRNFSLDQSRWKQRNLLSFPLSALRKLTLAFSQAPLALEYDYIGESWTGTLNGEDISPRINPHRAEYYVRRLQALRVERWVSNDNEDALRMLSRPVFHISLELELTDYSELDSIVVNSADEAFSQLDNNVVDNHDKVAQLLTEAEDDETARAMRDLALADRKTIKRTITIEIAPMNNFSDTPSFYGRIRETGEMFILSFHDAQGLAASLLDM